MCVCVYTSDYFLAQYSNFLVSPLVAWQPYGDVMSLSQVVADCVFILERWVEEQGIHIYRQEGNENTCTVYIFFYSLVQLNYSIRVTDRSYE